MTDVDKWKDPWFRKLTPHGKLMFEFLCDNCDCAGFWEKDIEAAAFFIGTTLNETDTAFCEIQECYSFNARFVWIKNFLRHQKNLPLHPKNNAHLGCIERLQKHLDIEGVKEILDSQVLAPDQPLGRGIGKGKGKGIITYGEDFETFWKAYPKKQAKEYAFQCWNNRKDKPEMSVILAAVEIQKKSENWKKDEGQYIPQPSTWLNQGRWADEPMQKQRRGSAI